MRLAIEMSVQEFADHLKRKREQLYASPLRNDVNSKWRKKTWGNPTAKRTMQRRRTT